MREPYIGHPVTRMPVMDRQHMVPVGPVVNHIRELQSIGMSKNMIVRAAGVTKIVVTALMSGQQKTTRKVYADALLAVDGRPNRHQALVLNVGCRRRIGGLMVLGYSSAVLAELLDTDDSRVRVLTRVPQVTWHTHVRVKSVFESLGVDGGSSRARSYAARRGFFHPLLWEDIDDPFETVPAGAGIPETDVPDEVAVERLIAGAGVKATAVDRREAFRLLREQGMSLSASAQRVGINHQTAVRYSESLVAA